MFFKKLHPFFFITLFKVLYFLFLVQNSLTASLQPVVAPDNSMGAEFGFSVANYGKLIFSGSPLAEINGTTHAGAVYLHKLESNGSRIFKSKITSPDYADGDKFGYSISCSNNFLIVGAPYEDYADTSSVGAAYIYRIES
ncbi:MAG: hypothetical protein CMI24_02385, partial [Opitutae bacterium]|nr:hypothetical protein [Opitutae bacterium]